MRTATSAATGGRIALHPWLCCYCQFLVFSSVCLSIVWYFSLSCCSVHSLAFASVDATARGRLRCWVGGTSILTPVLRTGRRKCGRQCTVCTDAMGEWGWWACLVQGGHSHIDLPQHVATARGSRIQAASCGSVCVSAPWRRKLSVAMQIYRGFTPRGIGGKKCGCVEGGI